MVKDKSWIAYDDQQSLKAKVKNPSYFPAKILEMLLASFAVLL